MKYGLIYADPPWTYAEHSTSKVWSTPESNYQHMKQCDIESLPVQEIAAADCALALWTTFPKLTEGLATIEAWGFHYTTCLFVWIKLNASGIGIWSGIGRWTLGNAELCLLGKRGHPLRCASYIEQILIAPRGRHSEKPQKAYTRLEALFGPVPRIELFARARRDGWDSLGNEIDGKDIRDALQEKALT